MSMLLDVREVAKTRKVPRRVYGCRFNGSRELSQHRRKEKEISQDSSINKMLICKSCFRPHVQKFMIGPIGYGLRITRPKIDFKRGITIHRTSEGAKSTEQRYASGHDRYEDSQGSRNRGRSPAPKAGETWKSAVAHKAMEKHLEFLGDPLKLANDVLRTLGKDQFDEALDVVRHSSKNMPCVVSWNHLIDWQLSKGKINFAMKTFNEVPNPNYFPRIA